MTEQWKILQGGRTLATHNDAHQCLEDAIDRAIIYRTGVGGGGKPKMLVRPGFSIVQERPLPKNAA